MKLLLIGCLLLALNLCQASFLPPASSTGVAVPGLLPVAGSHQFVARNYNYGYYVPTTTTAWPGWVPYPSTYYKYSGAYPGYTYPYSYYPSYNYGYGYKSVW